MIEAIKNWVSKEKSSPPPSIVAEAVKQEIDIEAELAKYLPHLGRMSQQLSETSAQIESAVVDVCGSFQGIAQRTRDTVARATGFLGRDHEGDSGKQSFESLIGSCSGSLVKILSATEEAGAISRQAIERMKQIDTVSQGIGAALKKLDQIAEGNRMLAMNARIEAAHAGELGAGFAVVAVEVVSQTDKSQKVTAQVTGLIAELHELAGSTLNDLQRMNDRERERMEQSRHDVDRSLRELQAAHADMTKILTGMTQESAMLASDIGAAVRGMQFQDRTKQRIAHVVEDLETLQQRLTSRFGSETVAGCATDEGFSSYTMQEERQVAGINEEESGQGEIELF